MLHGDDSAVGDLADRAVDWIKHRLANSPVGVIGDKPSLDAALAGSLTDAGLGLDQAWKQFEEVVAPNNIGLDSERFLAFIPLSPSVACVWMDTIVSAANFSAESWLEGAGAVAAENQVIELLCRAAGMPTGAAGCFMSGGSIGNLSALAVGRQRAGDRRVVAVADTAHASVDNALHLLGLEPLVVPTGPDCRLTGDALRATIGNRTDVGIIVAAGGSTNAGVIDDLSACADVASEIGAWFHVDGAYGLAAILLPELRDRFAGLERADSFIVDPHKWLFAHGGFVRARLPRSCVRLAESTRSMGHTSTCCVPATMPTTRAISAINSLDAPVVCRSGSRSALHGIDAHRTAIRHGITLAVAMADALDAHPLTELIMRPELGVVLFRRDRLGSHRVEAVGERTAANGHGVRGARRPTRANRSGGWSSCTRAHRSRSSTR